MVIVMVVLPCNSSAAVTVCGPPTPVNQASMASAQSADPHSSEASCKSSYVSPSIFVVLFWHTSGVVSVEGVGVEVVGERCLCGVD